MSISSVKIIKDRISSASVGSKIALFEAVEDGVEVIDAVFDNTVATQARINDFDSKYIGSYYGSAGISDALSDISIPRERLI